MSDQAWHDLGLEELWNKTQAEHEQWLSDKKAQKEYQNWLDKQGEQNDIGRNIRSTEAPF